MLFIKETLLVLLRLRYRKKKAASPERYRNILSGEEFENSGETDDARTCLFYETSVICKS